MLHAMSHLVAILFAVSIASVSASAQDDKGVSVGINEVPAFVRFVYLDFSDQVTDGCWTNATAIRSKTRLLLEQNDVRVIDYLPIFQTVSSPVVRLSVIGYRAGHVCVGSAQFRVFYVGWSTFGGSEGRPVYHFETVDHFYDGSSIFTNGSSLNEQIAEFVEGHASEFLASGLSSRQSEKVIRFFDNYPWFRDRPMSREEWNDRANN